MLVLARRVGQSVVIPTPQGEIRICVTEASKRDMVKLGFFAPQEIKIYRSEIYDTKENGSCSDESGKR